MRNLFLCTLAFLASCSSVEQHERKPPPGRVLAGLGSGDASEQGNEIQEPDSLTAYSLRYVGRTGPNDEGDGWTGGIALSVEHWSGEGDSAGTEELQFTDICLSYRFPDVLCDTVGAPDRLRLPVEIGTNWTRAYYDDGHFVSPGPREWNFLPFLSYRLLAEPELLLAFGKNWEISAYAGSAVTAGLVKADMEGEYNDYRSSYGWQYQGEAGLRWMSGPLMVEAAYVVRHVDLSEAGNTYYLFTRGDLDLSATDFDFQGFFIRAGITF